MMAVELIETLCSKKAVDSQNHPLNANVPSEKGKVGNEIGGGYIFNHSNNQAPVLQLSSSSSSALSLSVSSPSPSPSASPIKGQGKGKGAPRSPVRRASTIDASSLLTGALRLHLSVHFDASRCPIPVVRKFTIFVVVDAV